MIRAAGQTSFTPFGCILASSPAVAFSTLLPPSVAPSLKIPVSNDPFDSGLGTEFCANSTPPRAAPLSSLNINQTYLSLLSKGMCEIARLMTARARDTVLFSGVVRLCAVSNEEFIVVFYNNAVNNTKGKTSSRGGGGGRGVKAFYFSPGRTFFVTVINNKVTVLQPTRRPRRQI